MAKKAAKKNESATIGLEAKLWAAADALRNNMDAAEYKHRAIETAQVIGELIALAKEMNAASARGLDLGLSEDELAFYDALETNDSAVKVLGEQTLKKIARELVINVRKNVSIDWTVRENVKAQLRVQVKRILRKYGPARQAREGNRDGSGAGGGAVGGVGGGIRAHPESLPVRSEPSRERAPAQASTGACRPARPTGTGRRSRQSRARSQPADRPAAARAPAPRQESRSPRRGFPTTP